MKVRTTVCSLARSLCINVQIIPYADCVGEYHLFVQSLGAEIGAQRHDTSKLLVLLRRHLKNADLNLINFDRRRNSPLTCGDNVLFTHLVIGLYKLIIIHRWGSIIVFILHHGCGQN